MKSTIFLLTILGIILTIVLVSATYYPSGLGSLESFPANINLENPFNISATYFIGDGSLLTGIISGLWSNTTGTAIYDGNVTVNANLTVLGKVDITGNLTAPRVIATSTASVGTGSNWLTIYLYGSRGIFNSTYPFLFNNQVNIEDNLNVTGNITGNNYYAEMWMQNATSYITTPIASQNVWYNLSGFNRTGFVTGQSLNGFTYDNPAEHVTVLIAGKYKVMYTVSSGNAGNNEEYEFAVAINDLIQNNTITHRKIQTNGDVGNMAGTGFIDLLVADNVHLMVENKDGTADIQAHAMNLNLLRVGN